MPGSGHMETDASAAEADRLAREQAALRTVATLVARQGPQADVLTAIAEGLGRVLGVEAIRMVRFEEVRAAGTMAIVVAAWGPNPEVLKIGERYPLGGANVTTEVFRTGRSARLEDYSTATGPIAERVKKGGIGSAVGVPVVVEGRLWGAMIASAIADSGLPADTEPRLGQFTELMGTAIANTEARAQAGRLAEEQAALRRVATLVAQGHSPSEVFEAVIAEVRDLLEAGRVGLVRFESDGKALVLAQDEAISSLVKVGMRIDLDPDSAVTRVRETGRAAKIDVRDEGHGPIIEFTRRQGAMIGAAAPITIEGATWGAIAASWEIQSPPPPGAEERLADFAQLLDTAIANADSRDQLTASRARVLSAGDEARRRVVRDLHDGAQQRLVNTIVTLKLARRALGEDTGEVAALLDEALNHAEQGNAELRELAHGILPSVLSRGGVRAGVDGLVSRLDLPVEVQVTGERLPEEIEASAYFIAAEALTNVVKHAGATRARVEASVADDVMALEVTDDGVGGADPDGHGLLGLGDRVAALGGRLRIESPPGAGTKLRAELPLRSATAGRPPRDR